MSRSNIRIIVYILITRYTRMKSTLLETAYDDFYGNGGSYYAGKNAIPTDNATNKVAISANNAQTGFSKTTNIEYNLNTLINIASRHNVSGENP